MLAHLKTVIHWLTDLPTDNWASKKLNTDIIIKHVKHHTLPAWRGQDRVPWLPLSSDPSPPALGHSRQSPENHICNFWWIVDFKYNWKHIQWPLKNGHTIPHSWTLVIQNWSQMIFKRSANLNYIPHGRGLGALQVASPLIEHLICWKFF